MTTSDLWAISSVVYAIDSILTREEGSFDCVVRLFWEQRVEHDNGYGEGSSFDLAISDEGIILSNFMYQAGDAGGDHHSEIIAELTRGHLDF